MIKMRKICSYLKQNDMFAHEVRLNFNKQGDVHRTIIGSLMTWLIQALILMYMWLLIFRMIEGKEDKSKTFEVPGQPLDKITYH